MALARTRVNNSISIHPFRYENAEYESAPIGLPRGVGRRGLRVKIGQSVSQSQLEVPVSQPMAPVGQGAAGAPVQRLPLVSLSHAPCAVHQKQGCLGSASAAPVSRRPKGLRSDNLREVATRRAENEGGASKVQRRRTKEMQREADMERDATPPCPLP